MNWDSVQDSLVQTLQDDANALKNRKTVYVRFEDTANALRVFVIIENGRFPTTYVYADELSEEQYLAEKGLSVVPMREQLMERYGVVERVDNVHFAGKLAGLAKTTWSTETSLERQFGGMRRIY